MSYTAQLRRNIGAIVKTERQQSFWCTYVQRVCRCGYSEAVDTINEGLRSGHFRRDNTSAFRVLINRSEI